MFTETIFNVLKFIYVNSGKKLTIKALNKSHLKYKITDELFIKFDSSICYGKCMDYLP
jgi:hypothetical protein